MQAAPVRPKPTDLTASIDPVATRRWAAMQHATSAWLHDEVARRMAERLDWIKLPVERWVDWEPSRGSMQARELVAAYYPKARRSEISVHASDSKKAPRDKWWQGILPGRRQAAVLAPPEHSMNLVWANMLAHQTADPRALLEQWHRALADDGFLMFSCLGPDSLIELRQLYEQLGWPPPVQEFTDMHDWGDRLITAGFADPVTDQEHIVLHFDSAARLLQELRGLGRNFHVDRFDGLRTPAWRQQLEQAVNRHLRKNASSPIEISFEIIYGHALRPEPRPPRAMQTFTRRPGQPLQPVSSGSR